jgi:DNA-binding transcriptional LysR family regulator
MRGSEFTELKAFVAVVDRGSFVRAADHLGLSPSALSQTIRQLEARLGVRLLNRTTRSVAPTAAGRHLHDRIAPMIEQLDAAVADAVTAGGRIAGTLRINTLSVAARSEIAPRLMRFHQAYPDVVLDIVVDDVIRDIVAAGFDAGIRVGERLDKDMIAVRITQDRKMLAVASPDYLARRGTPLAPTDLHEHSCINWRFPGTEKIHRWEFERDGERLEVAVDGPLISDEQEIVLQAALQGLGILYSYDDYGVYEAIGEGRLVRILDDWSPTVAGLFLYHPSRRLPHPALHGFIDCLRQPLSPARPGRRAPVPGSARRSG